MSTAPATTTRRWRACLLGVSCALAHASAARAADGDPLDPAAAKALVVRALAPDRLGFQAGEAEIAMQLQDASGHLLERTFRARIASTGGVRRMRITFLAPSDQKGVEFLMLERPAAAPQQYLWLPHAAELRKLAPSDRSAGFQGSDFTLDDLTAHDVSSASITELGAPETIGGVMARRFAIRGGAEAEKAPGAAWREVHVWVAEGLALPLRIEFIAADGAAKKRFEVKRIQTVAGVQQPTRLVMSDLVKGTRTTLDIVRADPSAVFPESVFTPEALGR